jgi:hypothetical protein
VFTENRGRGPLLFTQKFCNSSLPPRRPAARTGTRANPIPSMAYLRFSAYPGVGGHTSAQSSFFDFRISIFVLPVSTFVFRVRRLLSKPSPVDCQLSAVSSQLSAAYFPRNFSMVESSASAISKYFLAPGVSCFCMAACALEMSVFIRCWAETMSPRRP